MKTIDWNNKLRNQKYEDKNEVRYCSISDYRKLEKLMIEQDVDSDEHILSMAYTHSDGFLNIKIRFFSPTLPK